MSEITLLTLEAKEIPWEGGLSVARRIPTHELYAGNYIGYNEKVAIATLEKLGWCARGGSEEEHMEQLSTMYPDYLKWELAYKDEIKETFFYRTNIAVDEDIKKIFTDSLNRKIKSMEGNISAFRSMPWHKRVWKALKNEVMI